MLEAASKLLHVAVIPAATCRAICRENTKGRIKRARSHLRSLVAFCHVGIDLGA